MFVLLSLLCTLSVFFPGVADAAPSGSGSDKTTAPKIASAQFPARFTRETEAEWLDYRFNYAARHAPGVRIFAPPHGVDLSGAALPAIRYADVDLLGRPMWFGGSRDSDLESLVTKLLQENQFELIEQLVDGWERNAERTADGKWKLDTFSRALETYLKPSGDNEYRFVKSWKMRSPKSPLPVIAEAQFWKYAAWNARGEGYSNTVDKAGWEEFYRQSRKAEDALLSGAPYASSHPLWGLVYLQLAAGLQWSIDDQLKFFRKLVAKNRHFYAYYFEMVRWASPKWYGDWDLIDSMAQQAETSTRDTDGASLYTRIYWSAWSSNREIDFFRDTRVDWAHMKRGFEDLLARYPHSSWNANNYAAFACEAGDEQAFSLMRLRMGNHIEPEAWRGERTLRRCEAKFPDWNTVVPSVAGKRAPTQIKAVFRQVASPEMRD